MLRGLDSRDVKSPEIGPRTVVVKPPSLRDETLAVLRTAGAIAFASYFGLALHRADPASPGSGLFPFQRLFRDLPSRDQRIFRQMQEGLLEAENVRSTKAPWPAVESLSAQGIPPFAPDPALGTRYVWRRLSDGTITNYLGMPEDLARPAFLLFLQEPDPDPGDVSHLQMVTLDEEHHRLGNGTIIHVGFWMREDTGSLSGQVVHSALNEGWKQILVGAKT